MVRFGMIGTGKISHTFMDAAKEVPGFQLKAVCSRSEENGRLFGARYGVEKIHTSLEALAADPEIDAVYVASPNSFHAPQTICLLEAGKHVLCEKPAASDLQEAEAMIQAARAHRVVFLEAMRPVFDPGFAAIREQLPRLGTIRRAVFQYCQYSSRYDKFKQGIVENAFNPALSNAALMDIGVYCVHPMVLLFGLPESVHASSIFLDNHMEGMGTALLNYGSMLGEIRYSKITDSQMPSEIQGEAGFMKIWRIADTREMELGLRDGTKETIRISKKENNMYYEIARFVQLVEAENGWELAGEHQRGTQMELQVMDMVRQAAGIRFGKFD